MPWGHWKFMKSAVLQLAPQLTKQMNKTVISPAREYLLSSQFNLRSAGTFIVGIVITETFSPPEFPSMQEHSPQVNISIMLAPPGLAVPPNPAGRWW